MLDFRQQCDSLADDALLRAVGSALGDQSNVVCEMAAKAVVELDVRICQEQLLAAYKRFLKEPVKTDKNCRAKLPIVEALNHLECDDIDFYTQGMQYVQMEPAYGAEGGYEDRAAHLRGAHAFGLIGCRLASPDDVLHSLIDLLFDSEWVAREHAARALSVVQSRASAAVLKMKVLSGDVRSEVVGACFAGLVRSDRDRFLNFVAAYLDSQNLDLAIEAGLALGESRTQHGAKFLIDASANAWTVDLKHSHLMSLGLSRMPLAIDHLVKLIGGSDLETAAIAIAALAPNRFDETTRERVSEAVNNAKNRELSRVLKEHF